MGRIIFFLVLVFFAILAFRILAKLRRGEHDERSESAQPPAESDAANTPATTLTPCALCAVHLPVSEMAEHLKQAHGAA